MSKTKQVEQTSPLPVASVKSYNNLVAFDTYIANNSAPSQNEDTKLIVKKDESYGPAHSIAYLGFNAGEYNIPDIIGSFKLRLHVTKNDNPGNISVYFVPDDSFLNTEFNYNERPQFNNLITSFSTGDVDADGWLIVDVTNSDLLTKFRTDGNISIALMGEDSLVYHEFSSSREKDYVPSLQLGTRNETITASNKVRYISVAITGNDNDSNMARVSEVNVINAEGKFEGRERWTVTKASNLAGWENMFDGSQDTYWEAKLPAPVYFIIDLGKFIDIKALIYTPQKTGYDGRVSDIQIYGSEDGSSWGIIGSRSIKHSDGNSPYIIFTGNEATLSQVEKSYSFPVKTAWKIELNRLKNQVGSGRSPLNVTELYFNEPGIVCIWIGDAKASNGDILEAREGHWDGSKRHRLQQGLNSFYCNAGNPLYLQIASNSSLDNSRVVSVRIMASNVLYYPVFRTRMTSQSEWLSMIDKYSSINYYEMITNRIILGLEREHFEPYKNQVNMQELADTYDECTIPTELAAGIRDNDKSFMHRPDVNPYHYLPGSRGHMTTYTNRIIYNINLTKKMVIPGEVRSFWGIWHEMGHNLQTTGLNWSEVREVSVNIYAFGERGYATPLNSLVTSYDSHFDKTYNALKNVDSYSQLSDSDKENLFHHLFFVFGETFMYALHRRYRENMNGGNNDPEFEIGKTADEQMNVIAIISSKIVQFNLVKFYSFWKLELTTETIETINKYNFEELTGFDKLPSELVQGKPEGDYDMRF